MTPTTATVAAATRSLSVRSDAQAPPSSDRSITSPPTRAHTHPSGRGCDRMPSPLATSRMPTARIICRFSSSSGTPISRATPPGAAICANPSPKLNQPKPWASRSPFPPERRRPS